MFSFQIYQCLFVTKHRKNTSKRFKLSCGAPEGLSLSLVETLQMIWWPSCFLLLHHGHVACCLLSKGRNNAAAFFPPPLLCHFYSLTPRTLSHITLYISKLLWLTFKSKETFLFLLISLFLCMLTKACLCIKICNTTLMWKQVLGNDHFCSLTWGNKGKTHG